MLTPIVTCHAVERYRERVAPVAYDEAERIIAAVVQRGVNAQASAVRLDKVRFVLEGPFVVTVIVGARRSSERQRQRCRHQIAFAEGDA